MKFLVVLPLVILVATADASTDSHEFSKVGMTTKDSATNSFAVQRPENVSEQQWSVHRKFKHHIQCKPNVLNGNLFRALE